MKRRWAFIALVFQNATLSVRLAGMVLAAEVLKVFACWAWWIYKSSDRNSSYWTRNREYWESAFCGIPSFAVPATCYVVQNALQYLAASYLDVFTYQLLSQLKLITTALCGFLLLGRRPSIVQCLSLLTVGVGVTISQKSAAIVKNNHKRTGKSGGIIFMVVACMLSGFAGVYTERLLRKQTGMLLTSNAQMAFSSLIVSVILGFLSHGPRTWYDFLPDFDILICICVLLQALGGFLVSWCIKATDSNSKNLAASVGMIASALGSVYFFDEQLTWQLIGGGFIVTLSTYVFLSPNPEATASSGKGFTE
ncbi:hypothetical protein JX266_001458 [Neoarthrinium moseri]|nr:hypothetical protein JX266_001458 [Neoarthrinium moseri]